MAMIDQTVLLLRKLIENECLWLQASLEGDESCKREKFIFFQHTVTELQIKPGNFMCITALPNTITRYNWSKNRTPY